jgi:hypothetical protein
MAQPDPQQLSVKLQEIEQQARLILDEMIAVPSLHRTRLLHIITLARQLQAQVDPAA